MSLLQLPLNHGALVAEVSTSQVASDNASELRALMDSDGLNEIECREYIKSALGLLVPYTGTVTALNAEEELPSASGPSDLIVLCDRSEHGQQIRSAYIWEIKAPQENIFARCNSNRLRPSGALNKAENQLLHYWSDCKTEPFRHAYGISAIEEIHLGGIIIGQKGTRVSCEMNETRKNALYHKAMGLRKYQFYKPNNMKLLLWDDIYDYINIS